MPRVTKVVASFGYTASMGQYESARMELSAEAEIQEDEIPAAVIEGLHKTLKATVQTWVLQQRKEGRIQ